MGMLTSLTSLHLSDCSILDCRDSVGWLAEQLATMTALQSIQLSEISSRPPWNEDAVAGVSESKSST
jgi:hypothetical protein